MGTHLINIKCNKNGFCFDGLFVFAFTHYFTRRKATSAKCMNKNVMKKFPMLRLYR